jgi:hypothetical protein
MSRAIPLGKRESEKLEFKGRDSRPSDIAREVVAFLNTEGGELWWGVKEVDGRGAVTEPFQDGEARKRDLQNHLIDTLEPSPTIPGEADIELVPEGDGLVIRIPVKPAPPGRSPVAQLKDQGRRYWLRVGDRVRMMSREEIAAKFAQGSQANQEIENQLRADREDVRSKKKPCFWLKIVPDTELNLDTPEFRAEGSTLLTDPLATGNRRSGWNFIRELSYPRPFAKGLRLKDEFDEVEIHTTGAIVFTAILAQLHWKGGEHEIWPYALLEYPVSVMRLAAKLFEKWGSGISEILVDFAFVGLRGWTLWKGSPRDPSGRFRPPHPFEEDDDLIPTKPFRFKREDIVKEPDRCGLRLITYIYRAFGYEDRDVPPEFDQKTGILAIPGG